MAFRELTADQERQFLDQGYVVVEQAVARDLAEEWRALAGLPSGPPRRASA